MSFSILSENIHIFPCGSRSVDSKKDLANRSRLLSEQNIVNIIKSICDSPSFVINKIDNIIKFVIDGYYFELTLRCTETNLYAKVVYDTPSGATSYTTILGDSGDTFAGLSLTSTDSEVTTNHLHLLDAQGNVPESSKLKFTQNSILITAIDAEEVPVQS